MEGLDEKDRAILHLLQEDGRISFAEMAKRLGLNENTVRFRFKRLVDRGVIKKIVALIDPRKIGLNYSAAFMVKIEPEKIESTTARLSQMQEITNIYQFTGEYDLIAVAFARDMQSLQEIIRRVKTMQGVREVNVLMTTNIVKSDVRYSLI